MKLRTRISLYLILFGMVPLLVAFVINVPMIFDRIEILYHKAHLQNLRAEFSDLDQHLARRHEMARLLAKMPEPGMLQLPDVRPTDEELGMARSRYVSWVNQVLLDQLDVTQVLFLDEAGQPVFWLDRNSVTGQLEINTAQHPGVDPRLHEASRALRPGTVLNGPIIFNREAGRDVSSRFMQISLVSPIVIPVVSSGADRMHGHHGTVIVYLDLGGLAGAYRGNYWVLEDGQYLPDAPGEARANSAFDDFRGLQELFSRGELEVLRFDDQQVLWVPLFETEDAGKLWVGRSVDASPLAKLQRMVELRIVLVAIGLLVVVFIVARLIAIKTERLGQELTDRITRVLEHDEPVVFSWDQPQELSELGRNLTRLAATHAGNTRALHDYAEELEASNRYKSEFLANVSHELRTPLNSILLLSKMLADKSQGALSDEQRRQAQVIHHAGVDLKALIDNILDLSRIEARQMTLVAEPVELGSLINGVIELMKPQLDEKSLYLKLETDPQAPQSIISDSEKIRQILVNFLSNAVKFTEQGGVTIRLQRSAETCDPSRPVTISVTDTGIGIAQEKHGLVFEAFKQADGSTSRRFGGTGLGLTISRELAYLLGGRIDVQSQPGAGSVFTLCLPAEMPHEPEAAERGDETGSRADKPAGESIPAADYGGARVLLVDDDMRNLLALTPLLEQWNLQVMAAGDGPEALDTLSSAGEFSLVFMDIMMPGMDGYEVIERIRQQQRFSELPVIALTAKAGEEDLLRCRESGANDCLVKPVDTAEIKNLLDRYLAGKGANGE